MTPKPNSLIDKCNFKDYENRRDNFNFCRAQPRGTCKVAQTHAIV